MFPAWAGMNRQEGANNIRWLRVPRVGGDEPEADEKLFGWQGVFPAWAGMNRSPLAFGLPAPRVPRVGGDEPVS